MDEPSSKLSEEDLGNEGTELCEAEPSKTEPRKAKKIPKGHRGCSHGGHHSRCPSKNIESFTSYFPRVLKQVHMGLSLSQEAVNVVNSFVMDMFWPIAEEGGHLARNNKRCTITPERSRPLCTCCCLGRWASMPCQRPPTWSSNIPLAHRLTPDHRNFANKKLFSEPLTWQEKTCSTE
ncbi:PREDICTED: histone H2B type F-M-like [Capra hircus]|uniref:histone H2B type F-M-like n=1 Tax=Capra hircus TaxID=9925 RepID=UPI000846F8F0|nr:PREDICTED: histone H2B type F-M-like [Capra hircus]